MKYTLRQHGFRMLPADDPELIAIYFFDGDENEVKYEPTKAEIEELCRKYDIRVQSFMELLESKSNGAHTVFVDVPVYKNEMQ